MAERKGTFAQTHGHTLAYTQNMSGQVTSSKKKKAGNRHQNSCLPGIVSSVGVHVCNRKREKREGMYVIPFLYYSLVSCGA